MDSTRRQALFAALTAAGGATLSGSGAQAAAPGRGDRGRTLWSRGSEQGRQADLGDGTYRNPVIPGDHPDPSILKDGATYYLVASSFIYYPGLVLWRSEDLINWTPVGPALRQAIGSVYAPDLIKHEGRFYIYFAVRGVPQMPAAAGAPARKPMTNYVIHADAIEGPWSDPVDININDAIDPGHGIGEDGKRYLYVSNGHLIPMSDDGLSRTGPDEALYDGWVYPSDWAVETFALEGPKIVRRGDWFYMFSAEGGTAGPPTSHMVIVARSRSIRGPWENSPHNPVVRTRSGDEPWWSRGHGTPVEDAAGHWWMLYHGYENGFRTLGRQPLLEPLDWPLNGWPTAQGGDLSRPLRKPAGRAIRPSGAVFSGPITPADLGRRFALFKPAPDYEDRLRFVDGGLALKGQGTGPGDASPLLLNAGDRAYQLDAEVELTGAATAGIVLFYNEKLFCGIGSGPTRFRAWNLAAEGAFEAPTPAIGNRLHLRVINQGQVGRFFYSADGQSWTLHRSFEVAGYNHNMGGGYLSLRPGVFASGQGEVLIRSLVYTALDETAD